MANYKTDVIIHTETVVDSVKYEYSTFLSYELTMLANSNLRRIIEESSKMHREAIGQKIAEDDTPIEVPTVYSTVALDGTVRMALYPMDSAPEFCHNMNPKIKFPFRVIYSISRYSSDRIYSWLVSCRGKHSSVRMFNILDDGIAWLVEGGWDDNYCMEE